MAYRAEFYGLRAGNYYRLDGFERFVAGSNYDDTKGDFDNVWWKPRGRSSWEMCRSFEQLDQELLRELNRHGLTYNDEEKEAKLMTNVSKLLSTALLVSRTDFAKLSAAKQTEVLTGAAGKPIVFVDDFAALRNKRNIVGRLVNGEDVSLELEFNEIELSDDEKKVLEAFKPIIERIRGATGKYPWIVRTEDQERTCKRNISITLGYNGANNDRISRSGYAMSTKQAKRLWDAASAYWGGGEQPATYNGDFEGYRKGVVIGLNTVQIGCQSIDRYEIEYVAEHYGWAPNTETK